MIAINSDVEKLKYIDPQQVEAYLRYGSSIAVMQSLSPSDCYTKNGLETDFPIIVNHHRGVLALRPYKCYETIPKKKEQLLAVDSITARY